jgi:MerR family transcriptional regulator, mercuric resistance operon regulatory protein
MNAIAGRLAIGALSQKTRCKVETIRYDEKAGLLPAPARSPGGYRLYRDDHLKRLTFIRRARALGFAIEEVRTLLTLADERRRPCAEVRVVATAHLKEVQAKIADLRAMERVLRETVVRCADGRRTRCPLIEALYTEAPASGSRVGPLPLGPPAEAEARTLVGVRAAGLDEFFRRSQPAKVRERRGR